MQRIKVKKGDMVKIVAGRDKGKNGKVLKVLKEKKRVVVEKVNLVKKHQRPDAKSKGGIIEKESSINVSNVMIVCNKCDSPIRVGSKVLEDGKKVRICRKCAEILDE